MYELTISAPIIKSNLSNIKRVYKENGVFYYGIFCVSCITYMDRICESYSSYVERICPSCCVSHFIVPTLCSVQSGYENKKAFKIDEVDMSMVPIRYQEALDLL